MTGKNVQDREEGGEAERREEIEEQAPAILPRWAKKLSFYRI